MASLTAFNILEKKCKGQHLTNEEIEYFMRLIYTHNAHDAQIGAFVMAVMIHGMDVDETANLTNWMAKLGSHLEWPSDWKHILVDKHSTGGIGDKISLVLAPLLAACGAKVPMLSGRGLGITGGTIDKLESLRGYKAELDNDEILNIMTNVGTFIGAQSKDLAPTDKQMYAIRNITATVKSRPLIAASILSKKISENVGHLVMDVKYGKAALNETEEAAILLAKTLVEVGEANGMKTVAFIDEMNHPLGYCIGNAIEMAEVFQCLNGQIPHDIEELVFNQAAHLLQQIHAAESKEAAMLKCRETIESGAALGKFKDMLIGQYSDKELVERLCEKVPGKSVEHYLEIMGHMATSTTDIVADKSGFIHDQDAAKIGHVVWMIGGGRRGDNQINHSMGIRLLKKLGDKVEKGETWAIVYHNNNLTEALQNMLISSIEVKEETFKKVSNIKAFINKENCNQF